MTEPVRIPGSGGLGGFYEHLGRGRKTRGRENPVLLRALTETGFSRSGRDFPSSPVRASSLPSDVLLDIVFRMCPICRRMEKAAIENLLFFPYSLSNLPGCLGLPGITVSEIVIKSDQITTTYEISDGLLRSIGSLAL